jgi:hypothetical protein
MILAILVVCCAGASATRGHVTEIIIGRDAAGRLKVEVHGHSPIELNPTVFPNTVGWAEGEPGFETLQVDQPGEDFFVPASTANLAFTLISTDPGVRVLNNTGSAPLLPGQTYPLGPPFFDIHPFFNITGGVPGQVHRMRIIVRDLSNTYLPTGEIELSFVSAECYSNCDGSLFAPLLTANDFLCFLNKFAANDPYANCDASTGSPALTANDFQCFINQFAISCE